VHRMDDNLSALIIGYQRIVGIKINIENCIRNGIRDIFVSIDYPKVENTESMKRYREILDYLSQLNHEPDLLIRVRSSKSNTGCAVNIVTACDWFFSICSFGVILEDDCRPNDSFFSFVRESLNILSTETDAWMISGTQLAPESVLRGERILTPYPQIWGWATSAEKWSEIREIFFQRRNIVWPKSVGLAERAYWTQGERRARNGFVDAWDIILASQMRRRVKFAISPRINLVSNVGVDEYSTHTVQGSRWMAYPVMEFKISEKVVVRDDLAYIWLKKVFYRVRLRHIFSTRITQLMDIFIPSRKLYPPLVERLNALFVYLS
jgi:hypothetical protein